MFRTIVWVVIMAAGLPCFAQIRDYHLNTTDSVGVTYRDKPRLLDATLLTAGLNIGVWAFDRYALNADYANISVKSVRNNFGKGFIWDNDRMATNMFLHPYHGSLYFNAARANGFDFWQSGLFALGGSAMWELLMESEYPSTNDIIATPIGGMALGEVFYRGSDLLIDNRADGWERVGRETASFIISPMRGITRLITGESWRKSTTTGRKFLNPDISVKLSAGVLTLQHDGKNSNIETGFTSELEIEYGDRFSVTTSLPYSYFSIRAAINIQPSQPVLGRLNILGRLHNIAIIDNSSTRLNIGAYQHFDFHDSDTLPSHTAQTPYKFCSPAAIGVGAMLSLTPGHGCEIDAYCHFNAIILGGVISDYYRVDARDYNLASGISGKTGAGCSLRDGNISLSLSHDFYRFYTWQGYEPDTDLAAVNPKTLNVQGDRSNTSIHLFEATASIRVYHNLYLSGAASWVSRHTDYLFYPDVDTHAAIYRLMVTMKL